MEEKNDGVVFDLPKPRPEFTDRIMHGQVRSAIEFNGEIVKLKQRIGECHGKAEAARFMGNGARAIQMAIAEAGTISGQIVVSSLEQIIENQVVIIHALHNLLYPNSPRILVEEPTKPSEKKL